MATPEKKSLVERAQSRAAALEKQEARLRAQLEEARAAQEHLKKIAAKKASVDKLKKELAEINAAVKRPRGPNKSKNTEI